MLVCIWQIFDMDSNAHTEASERRSNERVTFVSEVHYSVDQVGFKSRSSDLSRSGIYLEDDWPPEAGMTVIVEFDLLGRRIKTRGTVVASDTPIGFAIDFDETRPEDLDAIADYIAKLEQP